MQLPNFDVKQDGSVRDCNDACRLILPIAFPFEFFVVRNLNRAKFSHSRSRLHAAR
jgi:hypothetical protein